ncbi:MULTISPECIES: hypothetical protein [unclassified Pseudoxanthomonas]|uniref:hypothetical protein n=1 Tax=unclassified Pseudoxanthomonas TaxID=2645906 RepID=UPI0030785E63
MSTVSRRDFRSIPHRDAHQTWSAIVDLLTAGSNSASARTELMEVAGVASSVIADKGPSTAPIVVTCDGPRTRIYCYYDDDALDESTSNEASLGFDALKGDWQVSLPVGEEDLDWVKSALKAKSSRVVARNKENGIATEESNRATSAGFALDVEGFMKS